MATTIGSAYVQILPSADGIQGKLEQVLGGASDAAGTKAGQGFAGKFTGALGTLGKGIVGATAALGAGATAAGGAFAAAAGGVAQYGDNIDKMSQKMGLSAEKYQEWDAIMQHSGTSMESMKAGMKTLANAAETNNKAFGELGLTQEQIAGMSQEELFEATIAGLQNVEDTTKRTYLAGKLLGRGATELGPLLNQSAEETEKMRQQVHDLGGVMSDEAVKASAQFQDSLQDMKTAIGGTGRSFIAEFLPGLSGVMDGIGEIFAGKEGADKIEQGVDQLIGAAEKAAPKALEVGGKIVGNLGNAVLENAPRLMEMGGGLLLTVLQGIFDKLPELPVAGIAMISSLLSTLAAQAPTLIPAGVDAVLGFLDGILTNSDQLVDGGLELLVALAQGVANAYPVLVERAPELIGHFLMAVLSLLPKVLEAGVEVLGTLLDGLDQGLGKLYSMGADAVGQFLDGIRAFFGDMWHSGADLLDMFIDGIKARIARLVDTVKGVAQTVRNFIGFSEPKEGPLSDFHTYGPDMMEGYANGITSNAWRLRAALEQSMDVGDTFRLRGGVHSGGLTVASQETTPAPRFVDESRNGGSGSRDGSVVVVLQLDRTELGRVVFQLGEEQRQRIGVRLAT